MVKKLIKYEFIYYIRQLAIFLPIMLVIGIVTRIVGLIDNDSTLTDMAVASSYLMLFMGAFALCLYPTLQGINRFHKNMYSAEGYLTFTLPVTNAQHIFVKLLASVTASLACFFTVALSVLIAVPSAVSRFFNELGELLGAIADSAGAVNLSFYIVELLILAILSLASAPLLYYTCITIGQTAKKNRTLMAFGVYFIFYIISQVLGTAALMIITLLGESGALRGIVIFIENNAAAFFHILFWVLILISFAWAALCYFLNLYFMNRKLNLE